VVQERPSVEPAGSQQQDLRRPKNASGNPPLPTILKGQSWLYRFSAPENLLAEERLPGSRPLTSFNLDQSPLHFNNHALHIVKVRTALDDTFGAPVMRRLESVRQKRTSGRCRFAISGMMEILVRFNRDCHSQIPTYSMQPDEDLRSQVSEQMLHLLSQ